MLFCGEHNPLRFSRDDARLFASAFSLGLLFALPQTRSTYSQALRLYAPDPRLSADMALLQSAGFSPLPDAAPAAGSPSSRPAPSPKPAFSHQDLRLMQRVLGLEEREISTLHPFTQKGIKNPASNPSYEKLLKRQAGSPSTAPTQKWDPEILQLSGLDEPTVSSITAKPRGQRPDPSYYLSQNYIQNHIRYFRDGVTKFYPAKPNYPEIGPPEGVYVMPTWLADVILEEANGDIRLLEKRIGYAPGSLGENPIRIDCKTPKNIRLPSGNEPGANSLWIPGGFTSDGLMEAVVDQLRPGEYTIREVITK